MRTQADTDPKVSLAEMSPDWWCRWVFRLARCCQRNVSILLASKQCLW